MAARLAGTLYESSPVSMGSGSCLLWRSLSRATSSSERRKSGGGGGGGGGKREGRREGGREGEKKETK